MYLLNNGTNRVVIDGVFLYFSLYASQQDVKTNVHKQNVCMSL